MTMKLVNPTPDRVDQFGLPLAADGRPRFVHDPLRPTHLDFERYADWRVSKCRFASYQNRGEQVADLCQAVLEFVGEAAEFASLIAGMDPELLCPGPMRDALVAEAGDCWFTGLWVLDALGETVFRETHRKPDGVLDLYNVESESRALGEAYRDPARRDEECEGQTFSNLIALAFAACARSASLCNNLKKIVYQVRDQPHDVMAMCVIDALVAVDQVLVMAGLRTSDAMAANIEKLDARYPDGFDPDGPGGGHRDGKGK